MTLRLVPRFTSIQQYEIVYEGEVVATGDDPMFAACRVLRARGVTGRAVFWREGVISMRMGINWGAEHCTIENRRVGPIFGRWRPFPIEADTSLQTCKVVQCVETNLSTNGLCARHYVEELLAGKVSPAEQWGFLARVVMRYGGDACFPWPFSRSPNGYGRIYPIPDSPRQTLASRAVCELRDGPPPTPEHQAAHSCGKGHTGCVTPLHLRWATPVENREDAKKHRAARDKRT